MKRRSASVLDWNCLIIQTRVAWSGSLSVGPMRGKSAVLTHTVLFLFILYFHLYCLFKDIDRSIWFEWLCLFYASIYFLSFIYITIFILWFHCKFGYTDMNISDNITNIKTAVVAESQYIILKLCFYDNQHL